MAKLSDFKIECKEHKVDDDLNERINNMMDDPYYEFALESIEGVYDYIQLTGNVKDWMIKKLDALESYKERNSEE